MEISNHLSRSRRNLSLVFLLLGAAPAFATIDTFTLRQVSRPCADAHFGTGHFLCNGRKRIQIAVGERISIYLHGHFADLATDATGANIFEWIEKRGRTKNYPGSNGMEKGYVDVNMRARRRAVPHLRKPCYFDCRSNRDRQCRPS